MFLALIGFASALSPDATREQVFAELGKPTSVAKLGAREILVYPKGVRLELEEGKVVAAKGIALTDAVPMPVEPAAATPVMKVPAKGAPALVEKEKKGAAPSEADELGVEPEKSKIQTELEKAIEKSERGSEQAQGPAPPKSFDVLGFGLGIILKFLLTVAALKLACKYWGAEVFWNTILTVCAVDVGVGGVGALTGALVLGFPTMFNADDAVGGIVMLFLLKKLSVNHAIGQAIQLTLTTKTFIIVGGSFLVTILLRLMHH